MTDFELMDLIRRDPELRERIVRIARASGETRSVLSPAASPVARAFGLLAGRTTEALVVGVVDARDCEIASSVQATGTPTFVPVETRDVLRYVLRHREAAGFWMAHNHPSGNCAHSHDDRLLAAHVARAGATVGLRFLGSLVVVDSGDFDLHLPIL